MNFSIDLFFKSAVFNLRRVEVLSFSTKHEYHLLSFVSFSISELLVYRFYFMFIFRNFNFAITIAISSLYFRALFLFLWLYLMITTYMHKLSKIYKHFQVFDYVPCYLIRLVVIFQYNFWLWFLIWYHITTF